MFLKNVRGCSLETLLCWTRVLRNCQFRQIQVLANRPISSSSCHRIKFQPLQYSRSSSSNHLEANPSTMSIFVRLVSVLWIDVVLTLFPHIPIS
ncbi:hypothetical protein BDZ91DRAFT_266136 [Kalaharituber pfeilii]|nr:hypothetical protein BDZ91DRAFT_266136 [Kalaharituber pfeilii]